MAVQPLHGQPGQLRRATIDRRGPFDIDAELVLFQPGGDIGVSLGVHIRVDPQGDIGGFAELTGHL